MLPPSGQPGRSLGKWLSDVKEGQLLLTDRSESGFKFHHVEWHNAVV